MDWKKLAVEVTARNQAYFDIPRQQFIEQRHLTMEFEGRTESPATTTPRDISLVRGGLRYRFLAFLKVTDEKHWNVGRRILFVLAIVWLPVIAIRLLHAPGRVMQLVLDYRLEARVIAAVVLIVAEPIMDSRFRFLIEHIRESRLLIGPDLATMDHILVRLQRLRDSFLPDVLFAVAVTIRATTSYGFVANQTSGDLSYQTTTGLHLTVAGWYALLVSAPVIQLLALVVLWRWLLWTIFAFRLSRLNLRLVPSHPDENGGLGFLSISIQAFTPFSFALATIVGASFRNDILQNGKHLVDFKGPAIALVAILFAVAVLPLLFFIPKLLPLRRKGILQYSTVGHMQSFAFHDKWVHHGAEHEDEAISAPEMSTLCDYNSAYKNVEDMYPIPVDKKALTGLAISVVIPALPVILAEIPIQTVLQDLFSALR